MLERTSMPAVTGVTKGNTNSPTAAIPTEALASPKSTGSGEGTVCWLRPSMSAASASRISSVAATELIRLAEAALIEGRSQHTVPSPEPVDFGLANASVGIAAVGEFVLPLVTPVTAGMLVLSNIETVGAAAHQLREGKIGLPLLYTSIVGATLASGSAALLAAAVMSWFFRYWEHRYRQDLELENKALLDETMSVPEEARIVTADG